MLNEVRATRLGDLLVQRQLISSEQLQAAIEKQRFCHKPLGEVLLEMRLISRRQLNQGLKRQTLLRNTLLTAVLSATPIQICVADQLHDLSVADDLSVSQSAPEISVSTATKVLTFALEIVGVLDASEAQVVHAYQPPVAYDLSVSEDSLSVQLKFSF